MHVSDMNVPVVPVPVASGAEPAPVIQVAPAFAPVTLALGGARVIACTLSLLLLLLRHNLL